MFDENRKISFSDVSVFGQSRLRTSRELPGAILCLFYCVQELPWRAVHCAELPDVTKQRITPGNSRLALSVDLPSYYYQQRIPIFAVMMAHF